MNSSPEPSCKEGAEKKALSQEMVAKVIETAITTLPLDTKTKDFLGTLQGPPEEFARKAYFILELWACNENPGRCEDESPKGHHFHDKIAQIFEQVIACSR